MTRTLLETELESALRLGEQLAAVVPAGWPPGEYDEDALRFFLEKFVQDGRAQLEWGSFYGVVRGNEGAERMLVAAAGYHTGPDEAGRVEVGYSVVDSARGRGYATETLLALVENAFAHAAVNRIVANTVESNRASIAVLEKCGFVRVGDNGSPGSVRFERVRR
jgi:RimJ/RimL family protein N-acetyltransferase